MPKLEDKLGYRTKDDLITEDVLYVITRDEEGVHDLLVTYQLDCLITKEKILDMANEKRMNNGLSPLVTAMVIANDPMEGRIYMYNNRCRREWEIVGHTDGYA